MKAFIRAIGSSIDKGASYSKWIGFLILLYVAGMIFFGVVARYLFTRPIQSTDEVTTTLMVVLISCSMAYVFLIRGHIRADLVTRMLPLKWQRIMERVVDFITIIFLAILAGEFFRQIGNCMATDRRFETIFALPLWPVRFIGFLGLSFTVIYLTKVFIKGCIELIRGEYGVPQEVLPSEPIYKEL